MSKPPKPPASPKKNWLEWAVFTFSAAALIGVVSVLIHQAVTVGKEPALLVARLGPPLVNNDQVRIPVSVINRGDQPAAAVLVEIRVTLEGSPQSSTLEFDHVPRRSSRDGWVSFPGSEVPGDLSARVLAYLDP